MCAVSKQRRYSRPANMVCNKQAKSALALGNLIRSNSSLTGKITVLITVRIYCSKSNACNINAETNLLYSLYAGENYSKVADG